MRGRGRYCPVQQGPTCVQSVYDWTGPYVGLHVGYSWGRSAATSSLSAGGPALFTDTVSSSMNGVIGGGQIGLRMDGRRWYRRPHRQELDRPARTSRYRSRQRFGYLQHCGRCSGGGTLLSGFNSRVTDDDVRVGVNYKFGGPVIAKY